MSERTIIGLTYYNHTKQSHEMVRYEISHRNRGQGTLHNIPTSLLCMAEEAHLLSPERQVIKTRSIDPSSAEAIHPVNFVAYEDVPIMQGERLKRFLADFLSVSPEHFKYI